MSEAQKFFQNDYKQSILQGINTGAIGKVISLAPGSEKANIQPLFMRMTIEGSLRKQTPINGCPVAKHCRDNISIGDVVFYVAAQRSLSNMNGNNFIDPGSHTMFSDNDAVVLGVL